MSSDAATSTEEVTKTIPPSQVTAYTATYTHSEKIILAGLNPLPSYNYPPTKPEHPNSPQTTATTGETTTNRNPRARKLLLHLIFGFLLLNTALFALAVHNVERTASIAVRSDASICPCPLSDTTACEASLPSLESYAHAFGRSLVYVGGNAGFPGARWYSPAETTGTDAPVETSTDEYKLEGWRSCVWQVRAVRAWRWWMLWMVLPGQCLLEVAVAWLWWRCLVEDEREEQQGNTSATGEVKHPKTVEV
ncbi:hypothetical protein Dda_5234 [Drechslerella dactyloides]|uniref:Uncharacterized protein n=1 Tax=Drechslerella dactyloides TaxID=74499 RepID=A0AAD6IW74_DREDA|nr:hypothetical protein Dda_5234 [Drechslerella dactyloides]